MIMTREFKEFKWGVGLSKTMTLEILEEMYGSFEVMIWDDTDQLPFIIWTDREVINFRDVGSVFLPVSFLRDPKDSPFYPEEWKK